MKKVLSMLLAVFTMLIAMPLNANAASTQKAMFLFKKTLCVTCNVSEHAYKESYPYRKPIDIVDNVSGNGNAYAPFDCKVIAKVNDAKQGNTVAFESLNKVYFADGTYDYMTFMVAHDNNISDISIGNKYNQGDVIYQEGTAGLSKGAHIHLEVAKGAYSKRSNKSQSIWSFIRSKSNVKYPHDAFFLYEGTKISKSGGYTWKYAYDEYTLTYDANGGTGAPPSQTGTMFSVSSTVPTRTGYTFLGWSQDRYATSPSCKANDVFFDITDDITLYAVWKKNTYTLSYNANGGTGAPSTQSGSISYTISSTKPTRSGYTFLGWSKSNSATSVSYTAGDKITLSANTTLYAVWQKITYTLSYNANGGTGVPSTQSGSTSYTISSTKPTRSGYTFLGWSKSNSATSASYTAGDKITLSANTTLYAVWQKITYTLSYNANGGAGAPSTQSGSTSYTISSTKPTRSGYTFLGWATSNSATSANYTAGDKITLSVDTTLYAVWQKITYTLSYNVNGGTGAPSTQSGSTSYTISSTKPTRSGYTFLGWSTSNSVTSASYVSGDKITLSQNTTLYAVWQEITYTLSYNANGGTGAPSTQSGSTSYTISYIMPTKSGYTFLGWSTSAYEDIAEYSAGDWIRLSGDATLYAVWQKEVTERTTEELRYTEKAGTTKGVSVTEYVNTTEYETVNRETYVTELTVEEAESLTGNAFIELITESETEAENTTNEEQKSNVNDSNNVLKIIGLIAAMALAAAITAFIMKKKK